jgi:ABC-2 type transport system permease protein
MRSHAMASPRVAGAYNPAFSRRVPAFHFVAFAALLRREVRRIVKMAAMIILAPAIMAVIYFLCFALGLGDKRNTAEGEATLLFVVPGLIMLSALLRAAENTSFSLLYAKLEGYVIDQLMAPLGAREAIPAYLLSGAMAGTLSALAVWAGALLLHPMTPAHPIIALGFCIAGFGLLTGLASSKWEHMAAWFTFLFTPVSFMSGLFAPLSAMPEPFAWAIRFNPIFYAVEGFRHGMVGHASQPLWLCGAITGIVAVIVACTAGWLYGKGWRLKT